jgi:hypothetical protein
VLLRVGDLMLASNQTRKIINGQESRSYLLAYQVRISEILILRRVLILAFVPVNLRWLSVLEGVLTLLHS